MSYSFPVTDISSFLLIWHRFATCLHIIDHFVMERREEDGYLISLFPHTQSHFSGFIQIREETAWKLHCSCQLPPAKKINKITTHTHPTKRLSSGNFQLIFCFSFILVSVFPLSFTLKWSPNAYPLKQGWPFANFMVLLQEGEYKNKLSNLFIYISIRIIRLGRGCSPNIWGYPPIRIFPKSEAP